MRKTLLIITSLGEAVIGLILLAVPALAVQALFYVAIGPAGAIMTRIASIALIGLAVACWPASPRQPLFGMLTYSVLVMTFLIVVGVGGNAGLLLWPAVGLHGVLSALLVWTLQKHNAGK